MSSATVKMSKDAERIKNLLIDTSSELVVDDRREFDVFSPSLIKHAVNLHSNRAKSTGANRKPLNIFCNSFDEVRRQWSRSHSGDIITSSSSSFPFSDSDTEEDGDVLEHASSILDNVMIYPDDSETNTCLNDLPNKLSNLSLKINTTSDSDRESRRNSTLAFDMLCDDSSGCTGDELCSPLDSRRISVLNTPCGTLHVKGFSEGIGQYGIGSKSSDNVPLHGPQIQPTDVGDSYLLPMKDRLVVLSKIGQGSSSVVYKAFDISRLQLVAVKTVPIFQREKRHQIVRELNTLYNLLQHKNRSESKGDEDQHEGSGSVCDCEKCQTVHSLSSNNCIVRMYDAYSDLDEGGIAMLMEYMDAGSLQDMVEHGGCANELVLASIALQVLNGLSFLHSQQLIHRDVKPANILINLKGDVKISDLGILREVNPDIDTDHLVQTYIGTTTYMSPERLDAKEYSYSSDIWSFGMSLLTLSFGKLPQQLTGGYWTILSNIKDKPSPSLSDDSDPAHHWSEEYHEFITMCLEKDPCDRPSSEELLRHPFLQKAVLETHITPEVEVLGLTELKSILHSLYDHLKDKGISSHYALIVLSNDVTLESANVVEKINMSLLEMLRCILLDVFPQRAQERLLSLNAEHRGSACHWLVHSFISKSSFGVVNCQGETHRLSGLAEQLHLPLERALSVVHDFCLSIS